MNKLIVAALISMLATGVALAEAPAGGDSCEAKAVSKDGKPLAGAAKAAFMKKCEKEGKAGGSDCEAKAVGKNGKPLAGAAKAASIKKCEKESKAN